MANFLIIGGTSGIGRATVSQLALDGHRVYATYLTNKVTNTGNITYHQLDVHDESIDLSFLDENIDGIAFCPGSIKLKPFKTIKPSSFIADYNFQVIGFIKVLQAALPKLNTGASIVCYSTVAVKKGFNFHSLVGASKGAIEGLVTSLAAEFAPKYRINAIAPSLVNTPMTGTLLNTEEKIKANGDRHPLKRVGTPEDIAKMTSFLLSDNASWITGQILHVDGGKSSINL